MATVELVALPTDYNYRSSTAINNPSNAWSESSYTGFMESQTNQGWTIYDGLTFNGVNRGTNITGIKLSLQTYINTPSESSPGRLSFRFVTDYYNGHSTTSSNNYYTSISSSDHTLVSKTTSADRTWRTRTYSNTDLSSDEISWIRQNTDKFLLGTKFGIRLYGQGLRIRQLKVSLIYESLDDKKIYIGSQKIDSLYVGGQKALAVYVGATQVL